MFIANDLISMINHNPSPKENLMPSPWQESRRTVPLETLRPKARLKILDQPTIDDSNQQRLYKD